MGEGNGKNIHEKFLVCLKIQHSSLENSERVQAPTSGLKPTLVIYPKAS